MADMQQALILVPADHQVIRDYGETDDRLTLTRVRPTDDRLPFWILKVEGVSAATGETIPGGGGIQLILDDNEVNLLSKFIEAVQ